MSIDENEGGRVATKRRQMVSVSMVVVFLLS